jgi:NAD(P)H-hydrate repair Nnr-like enzyme with NAD(P)H-hydrate dehydratase domain
MGTVDRNAAAVGAAIPEAGVAALTTTDSGDLGKAAAADAADLLEKADAVLIGPGLLGPDDTRALVAGLLPRLGDDSVLVLDALAVTCGSLDDVRSEGLAADRVIITPNAKEAEYLLDTSPVEADPPTARHLAERYDVTVVLGSVAAVPDGSAWHNLKGNSGLGTSGSGDVLAGAVTGIAARGGSTTQAALWGLHLHSTAGDRLARRIGPVGYLARELLDELPGSLHQPLQQP